MIVETVKFIGTDVRAALRSLLATAPNATYQLLMEANRSIHH